MTRTAIIVIAMVLVLPHAAATQQLPAVIDQNIKSASDRLTVGSGKGTPQLWIHVRNEPQRREVEARLGWFKALEVDRKKVDVRPIQVVATGPPQSELRFFKPAGRAQAQALLVELRKAIPAVVVRDLSKDYGQAAWIDPGHLELWLAPGVTRLAVR